MRMEEVLELLKENQNKRGIDNWNKLEGERGELSSYGIGLSVLRKLAKQIGRDRELAAALWRSDVYDARVIGLLIDDPGQITRQQAESQVENLHHGMLAHVFSSCDATLAKAPFVVELAVAWMDSDDPIRKRCGYGLLYELSKSKKKSAPDEVFFSSWIKRISTRIDDDVPNVRAAMGAALMGIGKRSAKLNAAALAVARAVGPIHYADSKCDPLDVEKHLTSPNLKKKLGI